MNKKFKILILVLTIVLSINLVSCGGNKNDTKEEITKQDPNQIVNNNAVSNEDALYKVNDRMFREVGFEKVPETVVAIYPSDVEILEALGMEDKIIGIGSYVDRPESVMDKPVVSDGESLNYEEIVKLNPDVIFLQSLVFTHDQLNALESNGNKVVVTQAKTIDEMYPSIELIAEVMNAKEEGDKLVDEIKSEFEQMAKDSDKNAGKKIYFEVSPLYKGLWTAGYDTYYQEITDILGAENVLKDNIGLYQIDEEAVIHENPEYIFTISLGDEDDVIDEIKNRPGWDKIDAVKNDRIYKSKDPSAFDRPSQSLVKAAKEIQELLNK